MNRLTQEAAANIRAKANALLAIEYHGRRLSREVLG